MDKPISLIMEEAKVDYVNAINEITQKHNLNMYFVNIIMGAIYQEINSMSNQELQTQAQEYEQSQKTEKEKKDTKK
jgi:hypothetical protein